MSGSSGDCGCEDPEQAAAHATGHRRGPGTGADVPVEITVETFGPGAEEVSYAAGALLAHPSVRALADHADVRLLAFRVDSDAPDPCCDGGRKQVGAPASAFAATIYDYAENRVLEVAGSLEALDPEVPGEVRIRILGHQPLPSDEEFEAAVEVVRHDRELREGLESGALAVFRPMPPVLAEPSPDGRTERTLTVGLRSTDDENTWHEIVGVRMFDRTLLRELDWVARAGARVCEPPPGTDTGGGGRVGQCWITITSGGRTLWRFLAVRPGASSGTNGSGIELRYVDYKGRRVLYQAHVPILNVEYAAGGQALGCGPTYRDWQNAETQFDAAGNPVAPGFLLCPQRARTIIDSGSDAGSFAGVAIYVDGPEVVLVSEMMAGWYRYISEWRFHVDGTLRPRFGFAGTQNRCTCELHIHHVYWRLDFDLRTAGHNTVEEFNDPPIFPNTNWHTKQFEIRRPRDPSHHRRWRVRNTVSGDAYDVVPGANDGASTAFGVGDFWVLRYHPGEIDDGQGFTTDPARSVANLAKFMTPPESVVDTDVVVWYAAHYTHDAGIEVGNWVGPDLVPSAR